LRSVNHIILQKHAELFAGNLYVHKIYHIATDCVRLPGDSSNTALPCDLSAAASDTTTTDPPANAQNATPPNNQDEGYDGLYATDPPSSDGCTASTPLSDDHLASTLPSSHVDATVAASSKTPLLDTLPAAILADSSPCENSMDTQGTEGPESPWLADTIVPTSPGVTTPILPVTSRESSTTPEGTVDGITDEVTHSADKVVVEDDSATTSVPASLSLSGDKVLIKNPANIPQARYISFSALPC
jgi:hypothetical protein